MEHQLRMREALAFAACFKGTTSPNPTVGAVLFDSRGRYVGGAVTQKAGGDHAERRLLKNLSLSETRGGSLYVTLEPCCFTGRTPPCTEIILEKRIGRVFIATLDPNPRVSGRGVKQLRDAGIEVQVGICERAAREINQDFFHAIQHRQPFVFAKLGLSLDGFIATAGKESRWITGTRSRKMGHILRYRSDAILVGAGTANADNPKLTARLSPHTHKSLLRVVLDREAQLEKCLHLLCDEEPTLWVVGEKYREHSLVCEVQSRPKKEVYFLSDEKSNLSSLLSYLYEKKGVVSLMLEGGSQVIRSFFEQKVLQSIFLFYGPIFLGQGLSPLPIPVDNISQAPLLSLVRRKNLGRDFLIYGRMDG